MQVRLDTYTHFLSPDSPAQPALTFGFSSSTYLVDLASSPCSWQFFHSPLLHPGV